MATMTDLRGRHFLKLADFTPEEITYLLDLSAELKAAKKEGREEQKLVGKEIALIFEKDSTRTRCAFEVAAYDQGAHVTFIGPGGSHMGHKETAKDTARVLGRMYDAIEYRGFGQEDADELAEWSGVPVYNGLTDEWHPTQMLADFLTFREHVDKPLNEVVFCYLGDARFNMADSYLVGGAKLGMDVRIASPKSLWPRDEITQLAQRIADETGAKITITEDVGEAVQGADFLLTDVWVSMGEADEVWAERIELLKPYQVNAETMRGDRQPGREVHALPARVPQHRDAGRQGDLREVRDGVARGDRGGLRVARVAGLRRGREPAAHDQGRHGRDPRGADVRVVVALGGNALLRRGEPLTRREPARQRARRVQGAGALALEHELVISHGNGPQVGLLALQGSAYTEVDPYPLDLLGAQTEGMIGYLIQQELGNELPLEKRLASLLTLIEVDPDDPAFARSDEADRARSTRRKSRSGSPAKRAGCSSPTATASGASCRRRCRSGSSGSSRVRAGCSSTTRVVICAGGGGIPVMYTDEAGPPGSSSSGSRP